MYNNIIDILQIYIPLEHRRLTANAFIVLPNSVTNLDITPYNYLNFNAMYQEIVS